jgi:hypothetical protein
LNEFNKGYFGVELLYLNNLFVKFFLKKCCKWYFVFYFCSVRCSRNHTLNFEYILTLCFCRDCFVILFWGCFFVCLSDLSKGFLCLYYIVTLRFCVWLFLDPSTTQIYTRVFLVRFFWVFWLHFSNVFL